MKQLAVRSFGWALALVAIAPLSTWARNPIPNAALPLSPASTSDLISGNLTTGLAFPAQPSTQILAVTLSQRTLRPGDRGPDVRALQRYLSRNGLYVFEADGIYGQETANAVATYQRIRDLSATGIANEETLRDMQFDFASTTAVAAAPTQTFTASGGSLLSGSLAPGASGTDVITLQQRLNGFGIPVFVDGVYGFETQQAVRTYQRVQDLEVTGTANRATLEAMGFEIPNNPYIAAVLADETALSEVQRFFPAAYLDSDRRGSFINIGTFTERFPAEARTDAAAARGFTTRVLYRRRGLFR